MAVLGSAGLMRVIAMSRREIDRMHVLRDLAAGRITAHEAAQLMRPTRRHVFRLATAYRRRNAATRSGGLAYRATPAQWHAERAARRPKPTKLAINEPLRRYVQERLAGE